MFFLGFGVCFVILSISVEGLFYLAYSATLIIWIEVEAALRHVPGSSVKPVASGFRADDARIALFFLFFVQIAFFGTGK
jgi:GPI ethanolamine phosphate transferase 1